MYSPYTIARSQAAYPGILYTSYTIFTLHITACTCRPGLPLHLEPSCAPIFADLLGLIECWSSHVMNCPCPSQSSDCCFISGWALTRCRLSKAGLQGQARVPRHLRSCIFCPGWALGDERHCVFECPRFDGHRLSFPQLFDDAHYVIRTLVWHKHQKAVSALTLAVCTEA